MTVQQLSNLCGEPFGAQDARTISTSWDVGESDPIGDLRKCLERGAFADPPLEVQYANARLWYRQNVLRVPLSVALPGLVPIIPLPIQS